MSSGRSGRPTPSRPARTTPSGTAWTSTEPPPTRPRTPARTASTSSRTIPSYSAGLIGNDTADPTAPGASITSIALSGVTVAPDGSTIWASQFGADTANGGFVDQFDGSGTLDAAASGAMWFTNIGGAVASDSRYVYEIAEVNDWSGNYGIIKIDKANNSIAGGFTDDGHANPDGSRNASLYWLHYLSLPNPGVSVYAMPQRGIAVTNYDDPLSGSVWVADSAAGLLRRYDKVTGDQIGTPVPVVDPVGVAADASGDLWVSHGAAAGGPAGVLSVFSPDGVFLRDASEAAGLSDVVALASAGGKLYAADAGAGHVLVYDVSGPALADGGSPLTVGKPAGYGVDDGVNYFWHLTGVAADAGGDIYTTQNLVSPQGASGTQLAKWSPGGVNLWVKGGYEYQSSGGAYAPGDPTTLYTSSLHRYTLDHATGAWAYAGSSAYPGYDSNKWSGLTTDAPAAAPRFVTLGGRDFYTLVYNNRVLFYRVDPRGALHPSSIVGAAGLADGDAWTWDDPAGDGVPLDAQVADSGVNAGGVLGMGVDSGGNVWYSVNFQTYKLPLQGLDARGNPVYDWGKAVKVVTPVGGAGRSWWGTTASTSSRSTRGWAPTRATSPTRTTRSAATTR